MAEIAARHGANTTQIALAWLLRLSPTMLPIPSALSLRTYGPTSQELQLGAGRPALLVNGYPRPRRTGTRCFPPGSQVTGDGSFAGGNAILTARLTATGPRPSLGRAGDGRVVIPGASDESERTGGAAALGWVDARRRLELRAAPSGRHAQRELRPGDLTNIGVPPQVDLNAVVPPRPAGT